MAGGLATADENYSIRTIEDAGTGERKTFFALFGPEDAFVDKRDFRLAFMARPGSDERTLVECLRKLAEHGPFRRTFVQGGILRVYITDGKDEHPIRVALERFFARMRASVRSPEVAEPSVEIHVVSTP